MTNAADNELWAVTSFFNPTGAIRRLENYREFKRSLGIPLVTVEWSWERGPKHVLKGGDADILIQLSGPDLLWQKERLLNIGIGALPTDCRYVAWLDCDVLFDNPQWHRPVVEQLYKFPLVQPFGSLINLGPDYQPTAKGNPGGQTRRPVGNQAEWVGLPSDFLQHELTGLNVACGYAWAGRVEILRKHHLYDACVVGSGDRAIFSAAVGRSKDAAAYMRMNSSRLKHYLSWAESFYKEIGGLTGWTSVPMRNMWHGSISDRKYEQRHVDFVKFDFDPCKDISLAPSGCWQWASDKVDMHQYVVDYFFSRNEDGR